MNSTPQYGINLLSRIPIRRGPRHKSEMVSELLFGERYTVLSEHGDWLRIKCNTDRYRGWIQRDQYSPDTAPNKHRGRYFSYDWCEPVRVGDRTTLVPMGAELRDYDGMSFILDDAKCAFHGRVIDSAHNVWTPEKMTKLAKKYLNVPYLWGGRSPHGIDCSGYVQVVMRFFGVHLPRDASQQVGRGEEVGLIAAAQPGDLAFFSSDRDSDRITHVGLMLASGEIIHASGRVRIDRCDQEGIYREDASEYTHYLRSIKRLQAYFATD